MSDAAPALTRQELEAKIVKRCWENDAFRQEFVRDPAGCFAKYLNAPKAQLPKITVHEEQPGTWHIVLPPKPAQAGELSDEELEKIAGGTDIIGTAVLATMFSASVSEAVAGTIASVVVGATQGW